MPVVPQQTRTLLYRHLVDDELWGRLVGRIVKDHGVTIEEAELYMDGALGYLQMCANHPERRFAPAHKVDIGWHTFILYTRSYAEFCQRIAGRFIHHEPNDVPGKPMKAGGSHVTVAYMMAEGIMFDPGVWNVRSQACQDNSGDGGTSDCSPTSDCTTDADCDNGGGNGGESCS